MSGIDTVVVVGQRPSYSQYTIPVTALPRTILILPRQAGPTTDADMSRSSQKRKKQKLNKRDRLDISSL
jgi:hypothetical protein